MRFEVAAPGFTKDDFKVDVHNNVLTISSQKEEKKEEEAKIPQREFDILPNNARSSTG